MGLSILGLVAGVLVAAGEPAPVSVDQAARLYRIEIYQTFRADRPQYEARREAGDKVLEAFTKLENPDAQRDEVFQWFNAAREVSLGGRVQALPQIPEFVNSTIAGQLPDPKTHPVATSEKLKPDAELFDNLPKDVATSLDIELPPGAVNTTPASGLLGSLIKQALPVLSAPAAPPAEATTQPVVVQIPTEKTATTLPAPKQPDLSPTKPAAKQASQQKPATTTATDDDPFAVKNLFEPAVTPVETTKPATSADPFAP